MAFNIQEVGWGVDNADMIIVVLCKGSEFVTVQLLLKRGTRFFFCVYQVVKIQFAI